MVLSNHYIDGIGQFKQTTLPANLFEKELKYAGYVLKEVQPSSYHNRHVYVYNHPEYRILYAIYSSNYSTVITAYHP